MKNNVKKNIEDLKHSRLVTYFALAEGAVATAVVSGLFSNLIPPENKLNFVFFSLLIGYIFYDIFNSEIINLEKRLKYL